MDNAAPVVFQHGEGADFGCRVPFKPRTSTAVNAPFKGVSTYTIKGDFAMLGNTNLQLKADKDKETTNNSNNLSSINNSTKNISVLV